MRKIKIYLCFLSLLVSCSKLQQSQESDLNQKHQLYAIESKYDFGEATKDLQSNIPFVFLIKNSSDSIIHISKVESLCGCVTIVSKPDSLNPSHTAKIEGFIDVSQQEGKLLKTIFVNYGNDELLLLHLKGIIRI